MSGQQLEERVQASPAPTIGKRYRYRIPFPRRTRGRWMVAVYEWVEAGLLAAIVVLLVFTCLLRTATVSGPSMSPTLQSGDRVLILQLGCHDPDYGEIVVIDRTPAGQPPIIKRVIGKAGDIIDIDFHAGEVWRNGALLEEPYIREPTLTRWDVQFPLEVPEGHLFVMGDNRNRSADSRSSQIGLVDVRRVMGKAVFRFYPFQSAGAL